MYIVPLTRLQYLQPTSTRFSASLLLYPHLKELPSQSGDYPALQSNQTAITMHSVLRSSIAVLAYGLAMASPAFAVKIPKSASATSPGLSSLPASGTPVGTIVPPASAAPTTLPPYASPFSPNVSPTDFHAKESKAPADKSKDLKSMHTEVAQSASSKSHSDIGSALRKDHHATSHEKIKSTTSEDKATIHKDKRAVHQSETHHVAPTAVASISPIFINEKVPVFGDHHTIAMLHNEKRAVVTEVHHPVSPIMPGPVEPINPIMPASQGPETTLSTAAKPVSPIKSGPVEPFNPIMPGGPVPMDKDKRAASQDTNTMAVKPVNPIMSGGPVKPVAPIGNPMMPAEPIAVQKDKRADLVKDALPTQPRPIAPSANPIKPVEPIAPQNDKRGDLVKDALQSGRPVAPIGAPIGNPIRPAESIAMQNDKRADLVKDAVQSVKPVAPSANPMKPAKRAADHERTDSHDKTASHQADHKTDSSGPASTKGAKSKSTPTA